MTIGGVVIAAHNEEAVLARTLGALASAIESGVRVVVVCNGCRDDSAKIAGSHRGVEVVEIEIASKAAALREGDLVLSSGPRIYLDADVVLTSRACLDVLAALISGVLAGRPEHRFDTSRAGLLVRSWYDIRKSLPSIDSALWGAGCYALSAEGRSRFIEFPDIVSDDLFIDSLFDASEITIVPTDPVVVTTPRRLSDLLRILRRSYRTQSEVADKPGPGPSAGQRGQMGDLARLVARRPWKLPGAFVYATVIAWARFAAKRSPASAHWERDASSRELD